MAVAGIFYALFGWFPYASGYGATRASMFQFMGLIWKNNPEWEHCWLVPLAVIGLVYYRRQVLAVLPVEGSWLGIRALLGALCIYWVCYLADNVYLGYAALLAFVGAVVLWLLGWRWLKALSFPVAFLAFSPTPASDVRFFGARPAPRKTERLTPMA